MMTPIVFAMDDEYAMPTAVAIYSLLQSYTAPTIEIYILFKDCLSELSKALINHAINSGKVSVSLAYLDVKSLLDNASSHIEHISNATYYRLVLPDLLSAYDQCLYLDGDILVLGDIKELCEIKLQPEEYLAGVSTVMIQTSSSKLQSQRKRILGIDDFDDYINAGVLLMNLKALRLNNCVEKMIKMVPKNYPVQDQDILNIISYKKTKLLPPKYNAMPCIFKKGVRSIYDVYSVDDIKEARINPCIIHYANKRKPWKYINLHEGYKWRDSYYALMGNIAVQNSYYGSYEKMVEFVKKALHRLKYL
jgi:lipopolysaccharide biosynthesis glycosyltransferase